jgi:hypothetical protein
MKRIAIGLLALACVVATVRAASADIVPIQRLITIVNANPPLSTGSNSGRWWVSVAKGADAVGYLDTTIVDYGYTRDGLGVLIVPLPSGGSGGVFTTLLFTGTGRVPHYVGKLDSQGHLDVFLDQGLINARVPVYGPNDPQCCPSGHKNTRYRIEGTKLIKIDDFTTHA